MMHTANSKMEATGDRLLNSLGFAKAPADTRVVVAMSGGVDSSVTAALLHDQGYEVIGITLQLYDHGVAVQAKGACCAGIDIHDARTVSALGIPHYVLDYESRFHDQVMQDFADSYLGGNAHSLRQMQSNSEIHRFIGDSAWALPTVGHWALCATS